MSLKLSDMISVINSCEKCEACLDVCPTYIATENINFSPMMRLEAALNIHNQKNIEDIHIESMYNCPECARCKVVCPQDIDSSMVVAACRVELVEIGAAPLDAHKPILKSIREKGNSVNGDPADRLGWLPEECTENLDVQSETLLYAGCLPSYIVKEAARCSVLLLKRAGVDFTILSSEGCCGVYLYDAGLHDQAKDAFSAKVNDFRKLGIKRIVTPCAGCYRCFKRYYPDLLGVSDFEVLHITEYLAGLIAQGKLDINKENKDSLIYHDPCRLGRKEGLFDIPREILRNSGTDLQEMPENKEDSLCCGAGAGIRSLYRGLSLDIGKTVLDSAPMEELVTSCPFCAFNLSYTAKKTGSSVKVKHISEVIFGRLR